MGGERITIYAGDPIRRVLQVDGENRSGRLNAVCERFDAIISDELTRMTLSRDEWCAICDVLNGTWLLDHNWQSCWAEMLDSPEMDEKWGIDHQALGWRLHKMGLAGRAAIVDVVERFWASPNLNQVTNEELLREAGASWPEPKARGIE
jgi:hypothetical protein